MLRSIRGVKTSALSLFCSGLVEGLEVAQKPPYPRFRNRQASPAKGHEGLQIPHQAA